MKLKEKKPNFKGINFKFKLSKIQKAIIVASLWLFIGFIVPFIFSIKKSDYTIESLRANCIISLLGPINIITVGAIVIDENKDLILIKRINNGSKIEK